MQLRTSFVLLIALGGAGVAGVAGGCGGGPDCGPGTHLDGDFCVASESPGSGGGGSSSTTTTHPSSSSTGGDPAHAPDFDGVKAISPASLTSVIVSWDPATDGETPASELRYAVYLASKKGQQHFGSPDAIVPHGGTSYLAEGLASGADVFVVVRAIDDDGNQETNDVEKSGAGALDTKAPTFDGAKDAQSAAGGKVRVSWAAAKDDLSDPGAISYAVWRSETKPVLTSGPPDFVTEPGALFAEVIGPKPGTDYSFVVGALDAAHNLTKSTATVHAKPGADTAPPTFGGCTSVTAQDAVSVAAQWDTATDDTTNAADITYSIYAFKTPPPHADVSTADAFADVAAGALGGTVTGLSQDQKYYILCRAHDLSGNTDKNTKELASTTPLDGLPPDFGGLVSADHGDPSSTRVHLAWDAATDNQTPAARMLYDVYMATSSGAQDFVAPPFATSDPGAVDMDLTVPSNTELYFVVRARDAAGNQSAITPPKELQITSDVSFEGNVQPILLGICVTCHTANNPPFNQPYYNEGYAYDQISTTPGVAIPYDYANSLLYQKIFYTPPGCPDMPKDDCGDALAFSEIDTIRDWIAQGAKNN